MELQVEALPGWEVPKGCSVSVRLGTALKQRRFDKTSASYYFPVPDEKKKAKIDIYQHVGTCTVAVDPDFRTSDEITVACSDPAFGDVRLRVTSNVTELTPEDRTARRETLEQETKEGALGYLAQHGIEHRLSESIRLLLKMQPEDPIDFLCKQLKAQGPKPQAPERVAPAPACDVSEPKTAWKKVSCFDLQGLGPNDCRESERVLGKALLELEAVQGRYMPLPSSCSWPLMPEGMPSAEGEKLKAAGLLFGASDPRGRGIFVADSQEIAVWLNASRHVQILVRPEAGSQETSKAESVKQCLEAAAKKHGYALVAAA
eukprot:TRINITY_DN53391_c0_g1_i1.p1 TRINITY_DN53391_c0_g1~~TRINITY_DN53391_c0_g1_i1.p1  ORF type:complete len:317 (-),score=65.92 TRINITY_DN53391_c0_g1_i1:111-1061(-)